MGRSSDEIRDEIEETRQQAAQTAQALTQRLDVGQRAKDKASELAQGAREVIGNDQLVDTLEGATSKAMEATRRNPAGALGAAIAFGFVAGRVSKRRRKGR